MHGPSEPLRGVDLNLLPALEALLVERSVTRAAMRLGLSQPAVSNILSRLRLQFRDDLLIREGRNFALTPRGDQLLRDVREVLRQVRSVVLPGADFDPAMAKRHFSIALSDFAATVLLPRVLARLRQEAPGVSVEIVSGSRLRRGAIEDGKLDLIAHPPEYLSAAHPMAPVVRDRWVCVLHKDHRLARAEFTLEDYLEARHAVVRYGDDQLPVLEEWQFRRCGVNRKIAIRVPFFTLLPAIVAASDLVAVVQSSIARSAAERLPIVIRNPPIPLPQLQLDLQWHRRSSGDPALTWLRTLFLETASGDE